MKKLSTYKLFPIATSGTLFLALVDSQAPRGAEAFRGEVVPGKRLSWSADPSLAKPGHTLPQAFVAGQPLFGQIADALRGTIHRITDTDELATSVQRTVLETIRGIVPGADLVKNDDLTFSIMVEAGSPGAPGGRSAPRRAGSGKDRTRVWI